MKRAVNDDIIDRLMRGHPIAAARICGCVKCDAADEIERLRQLGDTLAYFVRSGDGREMYSAVHRWEEARRG